VLELAAGTGALTRAVTARLPATRVVATDLNPAMIDIGSAQVGAATWRQADAMHLPFEDAAFDLVVCQFGVMFFPDRPQAYAGIARVLRPGGAFLFNCWGPLAGHDIESTVIATLADLFPDDPPTFLARVPHGYHDVDRIAADLALAGFDDAQVETLDLECRADSAAGLARGYCHGTPLRGEIEARGDLTATEKAVATALEDRYGPGPVSGRMTALVVSADTAASA
jgi:SAM-dependent methyltransferase